MTLLKLLLITAVTAGGYSLITKKCVGIKKMTTHDAPKYITMGMSIEYDTVTHIN